MNRIVLLSACVLASIGASGLALSQSSKPTGQMDTKMDKKKASKSTAHSGTGVVKSVGTATGSITFAHEPIKSLNWPAMTMAFKVRDKSLLDKGRQGNRVQFALVQSGEDYVMTSIK